MKTQSPKTHASTEAATSAHATHVTQEKKTMSTHPKVPATVADSTAANAQAPAPTPVVFLTAPPADAHAPSPPAGFEPPTGAGANFRGVLPRGTELAAAPTTLTDLSRFAATYAAVLGATAPPLDHLVAMLRVASEWSNLRSGSSAWDVYCATEEGLAWQAVRPLLDKLTTAFDLAADSNKSLASEYPGLSALLGSRRVIAQKGVSTKRLNKKALAEGKPPYHGGIGKRRQRQAEKAAAQQPPSAGTTTAAAAAPTPAAAAAPTPAAGPAQGSGH